MRQLLFLAAYVFLCSCNFPFDRSCYDNYFDLDEDIGTYKMLQIPDLEVGTGDTLWIDKTEYFKSYNDCDLGYGTIGFNLFKMDYSKVSIFTSDNFLGIIGREIGETEVELFGDAYVRRDDEPIREPVSQVFNIKVVENTASNKKPDEAHQPFFKVSDVTIVKDQRTESIFFVELIFQFDNGFYENEYYTTYNYRTLNEVEKEYESNSSLGSSLTNGADFKWDSTASDMYLKLRRLNYGASETDEVSHNVQLFMHVKSYPMNLPPKDRTYELIGY